MKSLNDLGTLSQFVRHLQEGVYITAASGQILDANPAFLAMFGVASLDELRSHTADTLLVDPGRRAEELKVLQAEGAVREFELEIRRPDGQTRTVLDTAYQVVDDGTGETLFHGILVDITDHKLLERQLRDLAIRDPLTGCHNRRFMQEAVAALEAAGDTVGVIVIDIDHFKAFNDRHGHDFGDRLLVQVGRFLSGEVRAEDPVIRTGGDEFAILLPGLDAASTSAVVERLRRAAADASPASFTIGWAAREGVEPIEETLRRADQVLLRVRVEERKVRAMPPAGVSGWTGPPREGSGA